MTDNALQQQTIGFGTWPFQDDEATAAVVSAIGVGYRLIDTASRYGNEAAVGRGIARSGGPREQLFVQTKLRGDDHERVGDALKSSLELLGVDYLDSWLIHWPLPMVSKYVDAFEQMLQARDEGLVRQIGVSNFLPEHLDALEERTGERPWTNQIQLDPGLRRDDLVAELRARDINIQAWSPLARGDVGQDAVSKIASDRGLAPAQVMLAWHAAIGSVPIVRSSNPDRQLQNLEAISIHLSDDELAAIAQQPQRELGDFDPRTHDER
jgi:diketogulonate reductase-like aldo/keto reductase